MLIADTISAILIIASLFVLLTVVTTKSGEPPRIFGYSAFRVLTGSMEPTIPVDSLIIVKEASPEELQEGDVISFFSRDPSLLGEVNTHRIVSIHEEDGALTFETKGDANNVNDRYLTREGDLVGKVIYSSLTLGRLLRLVSNPIVFFPLVILPLVIMLLDNLVRSVKAAKKLAQEEEEKAVREAIAQIREKKQKEQQDKDNELQSEIQEIQNEETNQ